MDQRMDQRYAMSQSKSVQCHTQKVCNVTLKKCAMSHSKSVQCHTKKVCNVTLTKCAMSHSKSVQCHTQKVCNVTLKKCAMSHSKSVQCHTPSSKTGTKDNIPTNQIYKMNMKLKWVSRFHGILDKHICTISNRCCEVIWF